MRRKNPTTAFVAAAGALLIGTGTVSAGLTVERSESEPEKTEQKEPAGPGFDMDQYKVMADKSYSPLIEHGEAEEFDQAPSYGDPMKLADALNLLLPDGWKALRNDDTKAAMTVSWDISSGSWLDVVENLGARHGLQFHADHSKERLYIREGRKLLVEPESEIDDVGRFADDKREQRSDSEQASERDSKTQPRNKNDASADAGKSREGSVGKAAQKRSSDELTFDVNGGDDGERVMGDLVKLVGYDELYWMTEPRTFEGARVIQGGPNKVIQQLSSSLNVKACVYDGNTQAIAVVSQKTECPQ